MKVSCYIIKRCSTHGAGVLVEKYRVQNPARRHAASSGSFSGLNYLLTAGDCGVLQMAGYMFNLFTGI